MLADRTSQLDESLIENLIHASWTGMTQMNKKKDFFSIKGKGKGGGEMGRMSVCVSTPKATRCRQQRKRAHAPKNFPWLHAKVLR